MKKKPLGFRGAYGERNFGDDALMFFLYKWSRKNNLDAFFIGNAASYISLYLPKERYLLKKNFHRHFFRTLIYGGGTQFFSFENKLKNEGKLKLFLTNPIRFFKKALHFLEKKLLSPKKSQEFLYSVGIGLGPFTENSKKEYEAKASISLMNGVFVRDKFSYDFARANNNNTHLGTDICFLPNVINFNQYHRNRESIKKIGIILRDWNYSKSGSLYLDKVLEEASKLAYNNYEVDFILFKDEPQCELKIRTLNYRTIKWDPDSQKLEDFVKVLSHYDLFISARFHGVIFGSLLHIPSIAIEIEPKLKVTKELLNDGVCIWSQPFDKDLNSVVQNFKYKEAIDTLKERVSIQENAAVRMFDQLLDEIKNQN